MTLKDWIESFEVSELTLKDWIESFKVSALTSEVWPETSPATKTASHPGGERPFDVPET